MRTYGARKISDTSYSLISGTLVDGVAQTATIDVSTAIGARVFCAISAALVNGTVTATVYPADSAWTPYPDRAYDTIVFTVTTEDVLGAFDLECGRWVVSLEAASTDFEVASTYEKLH